MHSFLSEKVKELSKYNIDIYGLEDKQYVYDMESGDAFFEELEQDLIEQGHFKTHVVLNKSATMIQLQFHTEGAVTLTCDRSLETFEEPIHSDERIILKFGDHNEELTEEIEIISRNTNRINVARYIFDFIALSLPTKKIHPSLRTEDDDLNLEDDEEEAILVYSSAESTDEQPEEEEPVDPRWEALKKLKGE
ncbi:YceD family protein [Dyadobacter sp.]|uniref:YceD family protein n=1 Tax=Dyadobacter sp. TaxID=1914288 RepID=UPI003F6F53AE